MGLFDTDRFLIVFILTVECISNFGSLASSLSCLECEMQAHNSVIQDFLSTGKTVFVVPVYQRNYDWQNENCKQLFNDIIGVIETGRQHFLGTICFKVYNSHEGKQQYFDAVNLKFYKENYHFMIRKCYEDDIIEIDTYEELKQIDNSYN